MFNDHLPLAALDIVSTGVTGALGELTIRVEARRVKYTDADAAPPEANAWCYVRNGSLKDNLNALDNYLGPVVNVTRGHPLKMSWVNTIGSMHAEKPGDARVLEMPPINPLPMDLFTTIPQQLSMNFSVGVVTHLHGGKVHPNSDGWPLHPASFESNPFHFPSHRTYIYPNDQRAAMLWFHDHGMDNTAPQVHAGLAGLYFVRDNSDAEIFHLIGSEEQELPLVIQDRWLTADNAHIDYAKGVPLDPGNTGFKRPEFLGETIFVNGRPTPHAHVHPMVYRLRLLNGSNARSYALAFADPAGTVGGKIWYGDLLTAIGNDGGLFSRYESLTATDYLLLAPGERLDILIDLTKLDPTVTSALNLVNLAIKGAQNLAPGEVEPIFQTDNDSVSAPADANDVAALSSLPQASIMQFRLVAMPGMAGAALNVATLGKILEHYADDSDFHWAQAQQKLVRNQSAGPIAHNRLIFMMNDTSGFKDQAAKNPNPLTGGPWRDTQIWEMRPSTRSVNDPNAFTIPFDAQLLSPASAGALAPSGLAYEVARAWFFEPEDPNLPHAPRMSDPMWSLITDNVNTAGYPPSYKYAHLYRDNPARGHTLIKPTAGTYERWYVANIGNSQPLGDGVAAGTIPDMHPFHMHLVNFVVTRRWRLTGEPGVFVEMVDNATGKRPLDFDGKVRHDTVRIQSNEMVELLVYFPPGYTGRYPYHCHLVEHEDMGMMLHFEVQP